MATAIGFEIGIHNSTLAIFIALSVLNNFQLALPAAIYSVSMYIMAPLFGMLVLRRSGRSTPADAWLRLTTCFPRCCAWRPAPRRPKLHPPRAAG